MSKGLKGEWHEDELRNAPGKRKVHVINIIAN
jgi:hypothetical protein